MSRCPTISPFGRAPGGPPWSLADTQQTLDACRRPTRRVFAPQSQRWIPSVARRWRTKLEMARNFSMTSASSHNNRASSPGFLRNARHPGSAYSSQGNTRAASPSKWRQPAARLHSYRADLAPDEAGRFAIYMLAALYADSTVHTRAPLLILLAPPLAPPRSLS